MKETPLTTTHDEVVARLLAKQPELAAEYLKVAIEEASEPGGQVALQRTLRHVAHATGLERIAAQAGLSVASLSRSLSDRGNPTLKTLSSIVAATGGKITLIFPLSMPSTRSQSKPIQARAQAADPESDSKAIPGSPKPPEPRAKKLV